MFQLFCSVIRPSDFADWDWLKVGSYLPWRQGERGSIFFDDYISKECLSGPWESQFWIRKLVQSVQFSRSVTSNSLLLHESQHARPLSITNSRSSLKLMSIELVMTSSHLILCRLLLLLPPILPSIRVFSNESTLRMRWPKYWSFSFSISPTNEYPGLISFRMDWLEAFKKFFIHHKRTEKDFTIIKLSEINAVRKGRLGAYSYKEACV